MDGVCASPAAEGRDGFLGSPATSLLQVMPGVIVLPSTMEMRQTEVNRPRGRYPPYEPSSAAINEQRPAHG